MSQQPLLGALTGQATASSSTTTAGVSLSLEPGATAPTLYDRAVMGVDPALADRVAAALAGRALAVATQGRPPFDAARGAVVSWSYAARVMAPSAEEVARAQWAVASMVDGPAASYAAGGAHDADAVTDEVLRAAVAVVWPSLAGA